MKTGFFEEAPGCYSATRLVFIVGALWSMTLVSYMALAGGTDAVTLAAMFAALMTPLGAVKVIQRAQESPTTQAPGV